MRFTLHDKNNKLCEDSLNHLINIFKKSKKEDFRRESDIQALLYHLICKKLKKKELFLIHTGYQYEKNKGTRRGGNALDLVILSPDKDKNNKDKIHLAVEIKFNSAGKKRLMRDINKLKKSNADYMYLLYFNEHESFILKNSKGYPEWRKDFFKKVGNNNNLKMYYIEKLNNGKCFKRIPLDLKNPNKHLNILIYSNSPD